MAVDTSPDSQYALDWLLANLYRFGDTVHLLHCVAKVPKEPLFGNPMGGLLLEQTQDWGPDTAAEDSARTLIANMYCKKMETASVPYKLSVVGEEGAAFGAGVGDRVNLVAEELQASMIVVASHRKSALAEFMMGSISNFLVHHSSLPVLVVHAPRKNEGATLRASGTRDIVLGVDASDASIRITQWALANIVRHGDFVHVLHVVPAAPVRPIIHNFGDGVIVSAPYGAATTFQESVERQEELRADLTKRFSILLEGQECEYAVEIVMEDIARPLESVASAICKRCDEVNAAALVLASGNKGLMAEFFMGSVTSYCAHHCTSPVVVLH